MAPSRADSPGRDIPEAQHGYLQCEPRPGRSDTPDRGATGGHPGGDRADSGREGRVVIVTMTGETRRGVVPFSPQESRPPSQADAANGGATPPYTLVDPATGLLLARLHGGGERDLALGLVAAFVHSGQEAVS